MQADFRTVLLAKDDFAPDPGVAPKILQALPRSVSVERVDPALQALREATASYDLERLAASLRAAVPEFNPASEADSARASTTILNFPARRARPN